MSYQLFPPSRVADPYNRVWHVDNWLGISFDRNSLDSSSLYIVRSVIVLIRAITMGAVFLRGPSQVGFRDRNLLACMYMKLN
jgi:hypothetical protein